VLQEYWVLSVVAPHYNECPKPHSKKSLGGTSQHKDETDVRGRDIKKRRMYGNELNFDTHRP